MNEHDLLDAIGEAKEEYVEQAAQARGRNTAWIKWAAFAACFAWTVMMVFSGMLFPAPDLGAHGKAPDPPDDYVIPEEELRYYHYYGPVLPLTILDSSEGLSAQRHIHYDFFRYWQSSTKPVFRHLRYAKVTDNYILTNETDSDLTVTAVYPFTGSYQYVDYFPSVRVNGTETEYTLQPGNHLGKCIFDRSGDLSAPNNYLEFRDILEDGSYFADAFTELPDLDIPVVVYHIYDMENNTEPELDYPRIGMEFTVDFEKTALYFEGSQYALTDRQTGSCYVQWGVDEDSEDLPKDGYVIVVGEDLDAYSIHAYEHSKYHKPDQTPVEGVDYKLERYESTLKEMFLQILIHEREETEPIDFSTVPPEYRNMVENEITIPEAYQEIILRLSAKLIYQDGALGPERSLRFGHSLTAIAEYAYTYPRVFYACFEITVPAGGQIEIAAEVKQRENNTGEMRFGFDLSTTLGSNLGFTRQWASLSGGDTIAIQKYNNLRFDPETGELELDLNTEHYWMEVQKK